MELKPGYKQTEVGVIPEQWTVKCIGDIAAVSSGGTPSRQNASYWDGDIPWVTTSQVDFCVIDEAAQFISESGLKNSAAKLFAPGTLLMALYGQGKTRGKTAILGISAATNQACASIELNKQVDKNFVFHCLVSKYEDIRGLSNSGSQENLSGKIVKSIPIALPEQSEQQAIATALSDIDALISSLDQLIAKKRDIKQATMQQLLTGKQRLPGFSGEWEVKCFGELASPRRERIDPKRTGTHDFCVELEHIESATGKLAGHGATSDESSLKTVFRKGDVLFGKLRAYLRKYWLADRPGVCSTEIWALAANERLVRPEYLLQLVKVDRFIDAASTAYGTHMPRSDWNVVRSFEVVLPKEEEQAAIASVLSDIDAEIAALEQKRDKTVALKQGMMQELLTGRIRLI